MSQVTSSRALSLLNQPRTSIRTRKVALLAADGVRDTDERSVKHALLAAGAVVEVVAPELGPLKTDAGRPLDALKSFLTTSSVLYDAVYVPGGRASIDVLLELDEALEFVREAFLHAKPIALANEGAELLDAALRAHERGAAPGVVIAEPGEEDELVAFTEEFVDAIRQHRFFDRTRVRSDARTQKARK